MKSHAGALALTAVQPPPEVEQQYLVHALPITDKSKSVRDTASLCAAFPAPICMAFQPIVDVAKNTVFAYEALVRGINGEGARSILDQVTANNRYAFDDACRKQAVKQAAQLRMHDTPASLSMNMNPNAVFDPEARIERTLELAGELNFPISQLIFELTEEERSRDHAYLNWLVRAYRRQGMRVAIDDFGAGYAGLGMLAEFEADIVKIDISLIRGVDHLPVNCTIVDAILRMAEELEIQVIAEGVETKAECDALRNMGVDLMQGFYFARPGLSWLPKWSGQFAEECDDRVTELEVA
jgi:EAL domain-containing protein (putative c-di-GMP-specific phosphodiesterase class I)